MVPLLVRPASSPAIAIVPPATLAEMVPLLMMALPLPLTSWPGPMVPLAPLIVTPEATVKVLPPPSTPTRLLPVAPKTMLPAPASVWLPSKFSRLLLLMLIAPLTVMPLMTRPVAVALAMSIVLPLVSVTPERKLKPLPLIW